MFVLLEDFSSLQEFFSILLAKKTCQGSDITDVSEVLLPKLHVRLYCSSCVCVPDLFGHDKLFAIVTVILLFSENANITHRMISRCNFLSSSPKVQILLSEGLSPK